MKLTTEPTRRTMPLVAGESVLQNYVDYTAIAIAAHSSAY